MKELNVLGGELQACSYAPLTGFLRDGCCSGDGRDAGRHWLCARVTREFLEFSFQQGNDLITPRPEYRFAGLNPGDRWCLCASRWKDAYEAGVAPPVCLEATHVQTLELIPLDVLKEHAWSH